VQVLGSQTGIPKGLKKKLEIPEGRRGYRVLNSEGMGVEHFGIP